MINLFFSYSHRDEESRDELEVHLSSLKREGIILPWHDRRISAGDDFERSISEHLEAAHIILLLVSPYFLDSDYCHEVEMRRALERHEAGEARVIPVILQPSDWKNSPFGKILATPTGGKPIAKYSNPHDAYLEIVTQIRQVATELSSSVSDAPEGRPALRPVSRAVSGTQVGSIRCNFIIEIENESRATAIARGQVQSDSNKHLIADWHPLLTSSLGLQDKPCLEVRYEFRVGEHTALASILEFCGATNHFVQNLRDRFGRTAVYGRVKILNNSRPGYVVDLQLDHSETVFPLPVAIARLLNPGCLAEHLKTLYPIPGRVFSALVPGSEFQVGDFPAAFTMAEDREPFVFQGGLVYSSSVAEDWEKWDAKYVVESGPRRSANSEWRHDLADHLRNLRHVLSDDPCYYALAIGDAARGVLPIRVGECPYVRGAITCESLYLGALEMAASRGHQDLLDYFGQRFREIETTPYPILGITVLMMSADREVLIQERSMNVGAYAGIRHLAPGAMMERVARHPKPSIIATFLRELDEELFRADRDPETESEEDIGRIIHKPWIADLEGRFTCMGYCVDLLRHSMALLCLFRPGEQWWKRYSHQMSLNWEFKKPAPRTVPWHELVADVRSEPALFTPETCASVFLAGASGV
ncbi:MAG: toll/interleukin-1 receptor domain-containing protein [bacterium]|nr:toll/interleukin-1 receptor domain-containing protein [bacterium]